MNELKNPEKYFVFLKAGQEYVQKINLSALSLLAEKFSFELEDRYCKKLL